MKTLTMKFGGTSVGSPEAIENAIAIITEEIQAGNRLAVIVSAMSGTTDMLVRSVQAAVEGDKWTVLELANDIRYKHDDAVNQLIEAGEGREAILATIEKMMEEYIRLCDAITILGEATPRIHDTIVSYGERLSCRVIAAILRERGFAAVPIDATEVIVTDNTFQNAEPLWEQTETRIRDRVLPLLSQGTTPIITGFIGATEEGAITTLGRGGSDFSAAVFAAYLNCDELTIWTDVDGVMTTDPRIDKRARVLPYVSYTEVGEMAFYGAKVLHPKTVQPIINRNIPLRVRNTFNASHPGTLIGGEASQADTIIKAVTAIRNVSMLTVSGKGMLGVPGIAGRTFLATARTGASILMISQSSSEQSFCFTIVDKQAQLVKQTVEAELASEIAREDVDGVSVQDDVVIVTVVGAGMRGTPGVAGRVFTTLGNHNVNVISIAQGGSECSISFVIELKDLQRAVYQLHELALEAVSGG